MEYVNRRGERYYLCQGKTKTGKPKYFASRKTSGMSVEAMPDGFEFYEHPGSGLVSIRKIRPSRILPAERELVQREAKLAGHAYLIVEIDGDSIIVWVPDRNPAAAAALLGRLFGPMGASQLAEGQIANNVHYTAMFRFRLVDADRRFFDVDRWCFKGRIDDWIPLAHGKALDVVARKYLPHISQDSFYELM